MACAQEGWAEMTDDSNQGNSSFACSHADFWFRGILKNYQDDRLYIYIYIYIWAQLIKSIMQSNRT